MIQNTCESAVPITEFRQFLKTQRGYVADRLKSAKTSAERAPFLGALKMLDLVERGLSHFSRVTLPGRSPAPVPVAPPETLDDLGRRLIQWLGLPAEFPLACFSDEEWRADLAKYLPGKARAIAEVARLATDAELASHLLEILWEPMGQTPVPVISNEEPSMPQSTPPSFQLHSPPGENAPIPASHSLPTIGQSAPTRELLLNPRAPLRSIECPHCHRAFTNAGAMKSHAKACARFDPPASRGSTMPGDRDAVIALVDGQGRVRFNGQRYRLGRGVVSQQVLARLDGDEVVFSTKEGTQIKRCPSVVVKNDPATKKNAPGPAAPSSKVAKKPPTPKNQNTKKVGARNLEEKRCPHCRRLFGNVGAMKAHARFCNRAIKPEKLIQIAKENLPVPASTAHVNVTAHKVTASDRPWDGETFEDAGDADHFAGEVYDEKYLHRTGGNKRAQIPPSTLAERVLGGDALKVSTKIQSGGKG